MKSLRDHEGYLLVDHRFSPGVPDEILALAGLPLGLGRGLAESATYTCKHCQGTHSLGLHREIPATFCRGCQHLICDACAAEKHRTGICRTFDQVIDEILSTTVQPLEF